MSRSLKELKTQTSIVTMAIESPTRLQRYDDRCKELAEMVDNGMLYGREAVAQIRREF